MPIAARDGGVSGHRFVGSFSISIFSAMSKLPDLDCRRNKVWSCPCGVSIRNSMRFFTAWRIRHRLVPLATRSSALPLVDSRELTGNARTGDKSATIRERERFRKSANATNSSMSPRQMKAHCQIDAESTGYAIRLVYFENHHFSVPDLAPAASPTANRTADSWFMATPAAKTGSPPRVFLPVLIDVIGSPNRINQ